VHKFIIVTGGVVSGLGKGVSSASIARLLKTGQKIVTIKCDGYLNTDPGTMNPYEHGEVFVLEDGGEVDMDFGHYERFLDINCKKDWNVTSGKLFQHVFEKERRGDYLGKTVQIYPHVVDSAVQLWENVIETENADLTIIEIGGTIGDDENAWFVAAAKQLKNKYAGSIAHIHLTYLPYLNNVGELKTKPAQRDIAMLRERGLNPDIVICRSDREVTQTIKQKVARMCNLDLNNIINGQDVNNIYEVPILYEKQGLGTLLSQQLNIAQGDLTHWNTLVEHINKPEQEVTIAITGKYTDLKDSYASIIEALTHAGAHLKTQVTIDWVETTNLKDTGVLGRYDGILVPGGFGGRGVDGKLRAIQYAREHNIPYLGICYGLQLAIVEFARNVCGLDADTVENNNRPTHPVIEYLPGQEQIETKGGTMRLGAYPAQLQTTSKVAELYGTDKAVERHRHRYEVNPAYHGILQNHGMRLSGMSPDKRLVEFIELPEHPYFVASQGHNELTSRLEKPNPLFYGFVRAATTNTKNTQ